MRQCFQRKKLHFSVFLSSNRNTEVELRVVGLMRKDTRTDLTLCFTTLMGKNKTVSRKKKHDIPVSFLLRLSESQMDPTVVWLINWLNSLEQAITSAVSDVMCHYLCP